MYDTMRARESTPVVNGTGGPSDAQLASKIQPAHLPDEMVSRIVEFSQTANPVEGQHFLPGASLRAKTEFVKYAARNSAASTSRTEERDLLKERARLLNLKMRGRLNAQQQTRLDYVRWNLDQIENARLGPSLDKLQAAVEQYKALLKEIGTLKGEFDRDARKGR